MKKLFLVSCLIFFGLLALPNGVDAQSNVGMSVNESSYSLTRSLPDIREVTLKAGEYVEFNVGGYYSDVLASKYSVKFKIDSCEPEAIVIDRFGNYTTYHRYSSYVGYGTKGTVSFNNLEDKLPVNRNFTSQERIRVMNASTWNFKIGLSSGIHLRSQEVVNYNDIDFDL